MDLPDKKYLSLENDCPFTFQYPDYSIIKKRNDRNCWLDIQFPTLKCEIHLTYKPIKGNLREFLEQSHKLANDHQIKASNMENERTSDSNRGVFGLSIFLEGEVASNTQFYLTDSTKHFVRGALYFRSKANPDSLAPYIDFVNEDIRKIMDTFEWQD